MPWVNRNGVATADQPDHPGAQYVSWAELAARVGNPSMAVEAERSTKAWYREQAQRHILRAYNRGRDVA